MTIMVSHHKKLSLLAGLLLTLALIVGAYGDNPTATPATTSATTSAATTTTQAAVTTAAAPTFSAAPS